MRNITRKDIKQITQGNHAVLMDCLDFLLDSYDEDKWALGYGACLADMNVRSQLLAEYIHKRALKVGKKAKTDMVWILEVDELTQIIEEYFTKALKTR